MNKEEIKGIVKKYLEIFPDEKDRLSTLLKYLEKTPEDKIDDWNNTDGHITAGGFVYSTDTKRFLVMFHKDLNMFLYPGGHCEREDNSPLERAKQETIEETGIKKFEIIKIFDSELIPIDIDTHLIPYNKRVNMPEHYHFDFRYLFKVKDEKNVNIDKNEMSSYKWIDEKELSQDKNYGTITKKLKKFLDREDEKTF